MSLIRVIRGRKPSSNLYSLISPFVAAAQAFDEHLADLGACELRREGLALLQHLAHLCATEAEPIFFAVRQVLAETIPPHLRQ